MDVHRRSAIKQSFLLAGGVVLMPRYIREAAADNIAVGAFEIEEREQALLSEVVEALIPKTDTKGAKEIGVHLFVLKMLDDCHSESEQQSFAKGLGQLEAFSRNRFGLSFMESDRSSREDVIAEISEGREASSDLKQFLRLVKRRAIQGYLESEYVMTHVIPHKMFPDPYDGFYPAKNFRS